MKHLAKQLVARLLHKLAIRGEALDLLRPISQEDPDSNLSHGRRLLPARRRAEPVYPSKRDTGLAHIAPWRSEGGPELLGYSE